MQVVWTQTALRGVWRAYDYIFDFNPQAAAHMRELVTVSPYVIRYRVTGDDVVILRVRHRARRPTSP